VDATAQALIDLGINPDDIESAIDLAADPERRIKFQYEMQKFVRDHAISSTINFPTWGTDLNNEDKVKDNAVLIKKYAPGIRGLTWYPDGSRGGQPMATVPYEEAHSKRGVIYEDNSEEQCLSGVCNL
jgi:ribonucleoside-diphosphate reductase alpha chain